MSLQGFEWRHSFCSGEMDKVYQKNTASLAVMCSFVDQFNIGL